MGRPLAPCKDCKERHEGCHSTCEAYKEFNEKNIEFNKKSSEHNRKYESCKGSLYWH